MVVWSSLGDAFLAFHIDHPNPGVVGTEFRLPTARCTVRWLLEAALVAALLLHYVNHPRPTGWAGRDVDLHCRSNISSPETS